LGPENIQQRLEEIPHGLKPSLPERGARAPV